MAIVTSNTTSTNIVSLTSILIELFKTFTNETKIFVDKEFENKIKDYVADLGKTKDELKNLVAALDELDFKEDGTIDVKVLTAKVAANEAAVADIRKVIEAIKSDIKNVDGKVDTVKTDLQKEIDNINENIKNLTVQAGAIDPQEFEDLKTRVENIEKNLSIDIDAIKSAISF